MRHGRRLTAGGRANQKAGKESFLYASSVALTRDDILHLALLARLSLTEDEVARLSTDLSAILDHFTALSEVDTEAVRPTAHALPLVNVMRDDEVEPSLPRSAVLANAPAQEDGMFRVRAVLE